MCKQPEGPCKRGWVFVKTQAKEMRSAFVKLGSWKPRRNLADISIEVVMIVFAVFLALGVEERREERQLHNLADRARVAVDLELQHNLIELMLTESNLIEAQERFANTLQRVIEIRSGSPPSTSLNLKDFFLDFPEISTAAWRVAQASQAAPYQDFDWLVERARQYEGLEQYQVYQDQLVTALGLVTTKGGYDMDDMKMAFRQVDFYLEILLQLHKALKNGIARYLRESGRLPRLSEAPGAQRGS